MKSQCLKLHLLFHFREESTLQHKELSTLRHNILQLSETEVNTLPDARHATDAGSKVLEILSAIVDHAGAPRSSEQRTDAVMIQAKEPPTHL